MDKPVLIILPGWGGSHETWVDFLDLAKDYFDAKIIDLPCFGTEACPEEVWGVEDYVTFVKSKLKELGIKHYILLGHSFGGQIAAYFAAGHPIGMEKLILFAAAVVRPRNFIRRCFLFVVAKLGKILFRLPIIEKFGVWAKKALYRTANSPDYSDTAGIKRDIFKKIIRQDLSKLLPQIDIPTLVVWGERDTYTPLRHGKKINRLLPNSKLEIIKNGTHGMHIKRPGELLAVIRSFI